MNVQDVHGFTALSWACYYGYMGIAQILMSFNPNLTLKDKAGKTASDIAISNGNGTETSFKKLICVEFVCDVLRKGFDNTVVEIRETPPKRSTEGISTILYNF